MVLIDAGGAPARDPGPGAAGVSGTGRRGGLVAVAVRAAETQREARLVAGLREFAADAVEARLLLAAQ
jgi:hypothetical protein